MVSIMSDIHTVCTLGINILNSFYFNRFELPIVVLTAFNSQTLRDNFDTQ